MALSTCVMKIIVQIINVFFIIEIIVEMAIASNTAIDTNTAQEQHISGPVLFVVSCIAVLLSIFGIYTVAKSKPLATKVYAIIYTILLILNIIATFGSTFTAIKFIDITLMITLVAFCYILSMRFREEEKSVNTTSSLP